MDRADWLRIGAAFGVALVSSDSAIEEMRTMAFAARDAFTMAIETDRTGVNLDPMNVEAMLRLPYVDGTRPDSTSARRIARRAESPAMRATTPLRITLGNVRAIEPSVPTVLHALRGSKRYSA
jgi:hypothetical protein